MWFGSEKAAPAELPRFAVVPAAALVVLAWVILAWPWLSGRVTIPWDAKAHFQPQIQFLAQSISRGENPAWTPYVFSGHPQIADPQAMLYAPPFLALALIDGNPGSRAIDGTVYAIVLFGALAVLTWFRDRGWHWAGGVLAAIVFAFGASMAWRIQHTGQVVSTAYIPIILLLLSRALERGSVPYGIGAGLVAAFMVLGRDQVALLAVYLLIAYTIWHILFGPMADGARAQATQRVRRSLAPLLAGGITGALVIALPILMTALVAEASNRPSIDLEGAGRGSLHPALLITLFAPDVFGSSGRMEDYWGPPSFAWSDTGLYIAQNMGQLYMGAVPALLLIAGLASGALFRAEVRFFTVALLLMLAYALGWYTPLFAAAHALLPGVDFYRRPADATFLVGYLSAVLAGYAAHAYLADPPWRLPRLEWLLPLGVALSAFAAAGALAFHFGRMQQAAAPFGVALGIVVLAVLVLWLTRRTEPLRPMLAAFLPIAFTVADLAWSNGTGSSTALPAAHYEVLEPGTANPMIRKLQTLVTDGRSDTRRDRVELIGLGFHWPNASLTHRLENTLGYNPVRLDIYSRATGAGDVAGSAGDRRFSPLMPSYRSTMADLLGLRYVASGVPVEQIDPRLAPGDLTLVAQTPDGYIYENPRALPRVLYASSAQKADFTSMLTVGWPQFDPSSTVLIEGGSADATKRRPGKARILAYANTEVVVEADGPDGGWLVLNDVWHPWWTVEIDGVPQPMLRANVLFRAVALAPGRHEVRFRFRPIASALGQLRARVAPGHVAAAEPPVQHSR
ncbi:MAG: hypothetical protein AB7E80_15770 [Hyphomicrobiaceae bacterium]